MRKENDSPAISLFSFQDIITSITGIMFLVVLLLILLIFESKPAEPEEPAEAENQEIAEQIADLEKEFAEHHRRAQQLKEQLEEYQKMPSEQIEQRKNELTEKLKQLQEQSKSLKHANEREKNLKKQLVTQQQEWDKKLEELTPELVEAQKELTRTETTRAQLEKQLKTIRQSVKFSVDTESKRTFLLIEYSADGFRILDFATQKKFDLRKKGDSLKEHLQRLKTWLDSRSRSSEAVSVILGPASLKHWTEIDRMLTQARFQHGLEIYPDDTVSIFEGGTE